MNVLTNMRNELLLIIVFLKNVSMNHENSSQKIVLYFSI